MGTIHVSSYGKLYGRLPLKITTGVMKAIAETQYTGYIGHEFMPTRDPFEGLTEAVALCDV